MKCSLEILQTPIKRVLYLEEYPDKQAESLLVQGGVLSTMYLYLDVKEENRIVTIG